MILDPQTVVDEAARFYHDLQSKPISEWSSPKTLFRCNKCSLKLHEGAYVEFDYSQRDRVTSLDAFCATVLYPAMLCLRYFMGKRKAAVPGMDELEPPKGVHEANIGVYEDVYIRLVTAYIIQEDRCVTRLYVLA